MYKLDFSICGSANDGFFSQIAFFRQCLDHLGGHYREARLVAVFGDYEQEGLPEKWKPYFERIDCIWAHPPGTPNPNYLLQHERRFSEFRKDCDFVFLCDADVAILKPMDDLLSSLKKDPALIGVIAHYHFPRPGREERLPDIDWPELSSKLLGRDLPRPYSYTLYDNPIAAPFYINYGVFGGPPDMMERFWNRDQQLQPKIAELVDSYWAPQISVPFSVFAEEIPTRALPMRYNFPNDPRADQLYPGEVSEIIFLHYLRMNRFRRDKVFCDPDHFKQFVTAELAGSNRVFQKHVSKITDGIFPFA